MAARRTNSRPRPQARLRVAEHVLTREIDGELVLLNLKTEGYFGLDEIGTRIWAALTEHATVDKACDALLREYAVERPALERDIERLLGEMQAKGLVLRKHA